MDSIKHVASGNKSWVEDPSGYVCKVGPPCICLVCTAQPSDPQLDLKTKSTLEKEVDTRQHRLMSGLQLSCPICNKLQCTVFWYFSSVIAITFSASRASVMLLSHGTMLPNYINALGCLWPCYWFTWRSFVPSFVPSFLGPFLISYDNHRLEMSPKLQLWRSTHVLSLISRSNP